MDTIKVMSLVADGDSNALKALYEAYGSALYCVSQRITHDEHLSQEVLQDVFVKIWNHASRYDRKVAAPYTWMHTIARRSALHAIEKKDFRNHRKIQSIEESVSINTMQTVEASKDILDIPKMLHQLPGEQRKIVELAYLQGYTQAEIAKHLSIPLGTVKSRIRIALKTLKSFYSDQTMSFLIIFILMS